MTKKSSPRLPTQKDFDPYDLYGGDLDALSAWRNFGGLTLEEAQVKFAEEPNWENFMFMGPRAFVFYLPVLIDYLKTALATEESAAICPVFGIGYSIYSQLEHKLEPEAHQYFPVLLELVQLVRLRMPCFYYNELPESLQAMTMIEEEWNLLEKVIHTHSQSS